jgi:O-antigen ligase
MKQKKLASQSKAVTSPIESTLLGAAILVTISIWPSALDGFNAIKSVIFLPMIFFVFGWAWRQTSPKYSFAIVKPLIPLFIFLLIYVLRAASSSYWPTAFFGVFGRNIGAFEFIGFGATVTIFYFSRHENLVGLIVRAFRLVALIEVSYGLLQSFNLDPIKWNLQYAGIPMTFGNPNFAGTFAGLAASFFLFLALERRRITASLMNLSFAILALYALYQSKALQGLLIFFSVTALWLLPRIYSKGKLQGYAYSGIILGFGGLATFGIGGMGPLAHLLHKASVSFRGDFYRVAWSMFTHNPLVGVGIDRYGVNFDAYRDNKQVVARGVANYSDSAHNIFLQYSAIGGIVLLSAYVAFICFTAYWVSQSLIASRNSSPYTMLIFALWVGLQVDSLVSPETLGLSIWSWIFLGYLLHTLRPEFVSQIMKKKRLKSFSRLALPLTGTTIALVFIIIGYRQIQAEVLVNRFFNLVADQKVPAQVTVKSDAFLKAMKLEPWNIEWPVYAANSYIDDHNFQSAIPFARKANSIDRQDIRPLVFLAQSLEQLGQRDKAIPIRSLTLVKDPFNTVYMLELARDYKAAGKNNLIPNLLQRINRDDPNGMVHKISLFEFGG